MLNLTDTFSITVVKFNEHKDATYIGRGTPCGNPFKMNGEKDRDYVCDEYDKWFRTQLKEHNESVLNELSRFTKITIEQGYIKLGCFCSPRRCHGDTIKKFLDRYLNLKE